MKKAAPLILIVVIIIAAFIIGFQSGRRGRSSSPASAPSVPQDQGAAMHAESGGADDPPGAVAVDARKRQLIGIRVGVVEKVPFAHALRVLGRVAADDTRLYIINAATAGWIMEIAPVTPGVMVKKGDVLASFYAPELLGAQQAYLYGLNTLDRIKEGGQAQPSQIDSAQVNIAQYRDALRNLGMGERQMEEIARTRERAQQVDMVSPTTGIIVYRNIFPGLKFVQGTEFFRIADLSRVWILADVFEGEDRFLKQGQKASISLSNRKLSFDAAVSRILPLFDPASRTLKVRLEAANPGYALRPDMFVDVEVPVQYPPSISVPADAVLDSGLHKTVFVERGEGVFEPREVETGWRLGGRVEITEGLEPGEKIALSGTFLIDSESRMAQAAAGMGTVLVACPVSGAMVSAAKAERAGRKTVYNGTMYYFSSDECKAEFDANPQKYAAKPAPESEPEKR
jgi:membrane fusion protein, copper/silver efflux system